MSQADTEQQSVAARLEMRANALVLEDLKPRDEPVDRCEHVVELGKAPERLRRWFTLRAMVRAAMRAAMEEHQTYANRYRAELTAGSAEHVQESDRLLKRSGMLSAEDDAVRALYMLELDQAFPDIKVGCLIAVDHDWTVLQKEHVQQAQDMGSWLSNVFGVDSATAVVIDLSSFDMGGRRH